MWYLIVSIPDLCPLSYFQKARRISKHATNLNELEVDNVVLGDFVSMVGCEIHLRSAEFIKLFHGM